MLGVNIKWMTGFANSFLGGDRLEAVECDHPVTSILALYTTEYVVKTWSSMNHDRIRLSIKIYTDCRAVQLVLVHVQRQALRDRMAPANFITTANLSSTAQETHFKLNSSSQVTVFLSLLIRNSCTCTTHKESCSSKHSFPGSNKPTE